MRGSLLCAFAVVACLSANRSQAMDELKVGDQAPVFTAQDDTGKEWKSTDHVGKKNLVVYFYPANMTGGCTKQACAYRDNLSQLNDLEVEVVGVSGDDVESHKLFKEVHELNFTLLADVKGEVAKAFHVPAKEGESTLTFKVDGKDENFTRHSTISRWTFVINKEGKIAYINNSVKPDTDTAEVAKFVKELNSKS